MLGLGKYAKYILVRFEQMLCPYCYKESPSCSDIFVCANCELISRSSVAIRRDGRADIIMQLNQMESGGDSEGVEGKINELIQDGASLHDLYAAALFYKRLSNNRYLAVDYGRGGFMEENSDNRERSWMDLAKYKGLLYRVIWGCRYELKTGYNTDITYLEFTAEIALGQLEYAKTTLEMMNAKSKSNGDSDVVEYANSIYYSAVGDDATAIKNIDAVAPKIPGVLYYLAAMHVRRKRYGYALTLLTALREKTGSARAEELISRITAARKS
jgi:hypothetical protein